MDPSVALALASDVAAEALEKLEDNIWETYRDRLIRVAEKRLGSVMVTWKDWICRASCRLIQDKKTSKASCGI